MIPKLFAPHSLTAKPAIVDAARRVITSTDPRAIAAAQRGMAQRPDVMSWLPEIDLPTLVLVGEHDAISRVQEMQSIAESLPRAEFKVIAGAGHMAPVENPNEVNAALLDFLRSSGS
jgi:pimeloyl-ACP methyl ester carboxylesterase